MEGHFNDLKREAAAALAAESLTLNACAFSREMDMRYAGQGYELRVGVDKVAGLGAVDIDILREAFHALHEEQHGHAARDGVVEVVSYRLRATIGTPKVTLQDNTQALAATGAVTERPAALSGLERSKQHQLPSCIVWN